MRLAPFAPALDNPAAQHNQRHPWLHALELFAVPFFCYSADGRCVDSSTSAKKLADDTPDGATLCGQIDRMVADELRRSQACLRLGQLLLVRELPSFSRTLTLALHLARPSLCGVSAVVVARPHVDDRRSEARPIAGLTPRECEIARLIAIGLTTKTVAAQLGISTHTARHHIERLYDKLGVHTRAGVAALLGSRIGHSTHRPAVAVD